MNDRKSNLELFCRLARRLFLKNLGKIWKTSVYHYCYYRALSATITVEVTYCERLRESADSLGPLERGSLRFSAFSLKRFFLESGKWWRSPVGASESLKE